MAVRKRTNLFLIFQIIIASILLAASIVVIGISVRKYREQKSHQSNESSMLRTTSPMMLSLSPSSLSSISPTGILSPTDLVSPTNSPVLTIPNDAPTNPNSPTTTTALTPASPTIPVAPVSMPQVSTYAPTLSISPLAYPTLQLVAVPPELPIAKTTTPPPLETTTTATTIIFYALGDAPYNETQAVTLRRQMRDIPKDAEFIVHLGDIRHSGTECFENEYEVVRKIFRLSEIPVFAVVGDNEVNDCPNPNEALTYWEKEFLYIPQDYWSIPFQVHRRLNHMEQYHFQHKDTLFLGLNLIGGLIANVTKRNEELQSQWQWAESIIESYRLSLGSNSTTAAPNTGRVVLFAHAVDFDTKHAAFFAPFKVYYEVHQNQLALLILAGDRHKWEYEDAFMGFTNAKRLVVSGETVDPLLKVLIDENRPNPFAYDRRLDHSA